MRLKPLLLAAALGIAVPLAGCAGSLNVGNPSPQTQRTVLQAVEYSCVIATGAITTINQYNARLSANQKAIVARARLTTDPICTQLAVPTLSATAQAAFDGAIAQLTDTAKAVQP